MSDEQQQPQPRRPPRNDPWTEVPDHTDGLGRYAHEEPPPRWDEDDPEAPSQIDPYEPPAAHDQSPDLQMALKDELESQGADPLNGTLIDTGPVPGGAFGADSATPVAAPAEPANGNGQAGRHAADDARSYEFVDSRPPLRTADRFAPDEDAPLGPVAADTMKIGIWGSPGSGKTTYLAALKHDAMIRAGNEIGTWKIIPRNEASEQLLTEWTHLLVEEQQFPDATALGSTTELWWHFMGDLTGSRYTRRRWGMFGRPAPASEFDLELIDVSGEAFGYRPTQRHVPEELVRRMLAHLAESDGLVFLFDPITERDTPSVATYVERVLNNLTRTVYHQGRMVDGYLPHHVAVCITKTDHPELVERARVAGLVNTGPDGIDRVLNSQAQDLFQAICAGGFWGPDDRSHGGAEFVRNQLRVYFHPDRIRYYAVSAIGHQNLAMRDGKLRITGPIRPFNVLEPLVELHMQLRNRT